VREVEVAEHACVGDAGSGIADALKIEIDVHVRVHSDVISVSAGNIRITSETVKSPLCPIQFVV
jgi:hypothetical protein